MYKKLSMEQFKNQLLDRKTNSVLCKCGHRLFISKNKGYAVCNFCGERYKSPKEEFKNKLTSLLRANG